MTSALKPAIDTLLADHPPAIRRLALRLRRHLLAHVPEAGERVYRGWHGLGYHVPGAGYVCAIFPRDDYIEVGFEHGALLDDPTGVFTRGGKQIRYARLDVWDEEKAAALLDLVDQAIAPQSG